MGTLLLMGAFISALLKATGFGGKKRKKRRKERIWSREKSPAARANTRDGGCFEGGVLGDKIQSLFPKDGRSEGMREQGKEKKDRGGNFPNICVSKSQFFHQVLSPLLHTSSLLFLETSAVASTTTKPRKCH